MKTAAAAIDSGEFDIATAQIDALAAEHFDDSASWIRLAKLAERARSDEMALFCWRSVLQLEHQLLPVLRAAAILHRQSRLDEEIQLLNSAVEGGLDDLRIRRRLAVALDAVGHYELAETQWRVIVQNDPDDRDAGKFLSRAADRALMDFDRSVEIIPGSNPLLKFHDTPEFIEHLERMATRQIRNLPVPTHSPRRLLFVSSNWSFMPELINQFQSDEFFSVRSLDYLGIIRRPVQASNPVLPEYARELLWWADVIFVDWANEAASWVIQFAPPHSKIVVRLHSYELLRRWPMFTDWTRVDDCIFVAEHNRQRLLEALDIESLGCRTHVIPNVAALHRFGLPKHPDAALTLGMAGYNTPNKQPLMAFDLLERLRAADSRWRLRLVGHPWRTANSAVDKEYDEAFRHRADELELSGTLQIDEWTADLPNWFRGVGVVLSCSEREGSHESIREGISSGACGLVRNWPWSIGYGGAAPSFPDSFVYDDIDEAANHLIKLASNEGTLARGATERAALLQREAPEQVIAQIRRILCR